MFDKEYRFTGIHAQKINCLKASLCGSDKSIQFFASYVDVLENAGIIGFLYKRKVSVDNTTNDDTKNAHILSSQLLNHYDKILFSYKLIVLLDEKFEPNSKIRIDTAFMSQDDENYEEQNKKFVENFYDYVRGGIDVLYEKIIGNAKSLDGYVKNLNEFINDFNEIFNESVDIKALEEIHV